MDCDLQDKPSEIKKLFNYTLSNPESQVVFAERENRQDSFSKKITAKIIAFFLFTFYVNSKAESGFTSHNDDFIE